MKTYMVSLLILAAGAAAYAQAPAQTPAQPQRTPPVAPITQETPLPPPIRLPAPPQVPADVPNRPLSADEASRIALFHAPAIAAVRAGITAAQGVTQQARAGLLPSISSTISYTDVRAIAGMSTGSVSTGGGGVTFAGYLASGTLRQLVFDFNHTRDEVRQAAEQELVASSALDKAQSDVVLQVKEAFYTYVQDDRLVQVNETNVRDSQAHLAQTEALLKSGLGLPSDVVRAQTAVSDAILNLNLARNTASDERVSVATLMGIDPRTPIEPAESDEPAPPAADVTTLIDEAVRQRPEILAAEASLRSTEFGLSAARTTNAPSLGLSLAVSSRGPNFPPDTDLFSVTASILWNPFDGGLTAGRVKEARASVTSASANLESARLGVISDVSQSWLNLGAAEQRVVTAQAEVANAQESVRLAEGRYRAGIGTFIDLVDAQSALVTAQTNEVNARSAVDQARAAVAHAIGAPLPGAPR